MRGIPLKLHKLQCHSCRLCSTSFSSALNQREQFQKSKEARQNRLDNTGNGNKSTNDNNQWVTAPILQQQTSGIPGAETYTKPVYPSKRRQQQYTNNRTDPSEAIKRNAMSKDFQGNENIKLTFNNSTSGGKKDIYFAGRKESDNHYQKLYTNFLIEHGFTEEEDISEQYEWLSQSHEIQYDPDDYYGLRLPTNHKGKRDQNEWSEKELYYGKSFKKEKLEFNHFNKSFILDSCPPFPDRMVHEEPNYENNTAPLYLPHVSQNIPMWSLKKKIAKTYGPSYMKEITMPPIKLPSNEDFQAMLQQYVNEKKYKQHAVENIKDINTSKKMKDKHLYKYLSKNEPNKYIMNDPNANYFAENKGRIKELGVGTPFDGGDNDIICRDYEIWDKDLCYELKHNGDPSIPMQFKDEIFKQYVNSIDRNGSMAPWQKNYAFSLLPKAFGGPQGLYIETILARMKPKQENLKYKLEKFGHDVAIDIKQQTNEIVDVTGLGL